MNGMDLVTRKYDACKVDPQSLGRGARGLKIGTKGLRIPSLFQTIEMREGMSADLLGRIVEDSLDQREAIVVGVVLLVRPDLFKILIRGNSRIGVARLAGGKPGEQGPLRRKKQQPYRCPCAGNVALGEQIEQRGNGLAHSKDVSAVIRDRALVTDAPYQLEIQRNDQHAI